MSISYLLWHILELTYVTSFNVSAAQEYDEIVHSGPLGTSNYLLNGKNVKPDLSAGTHTTWEFEAGKKYLFRFVNAAAQSGSTTGRAGRTR